MLLRQTIFIFKGRKHQLLSNKIKISLINLTIGQSGSLGSEITKFFSILSNVVARSIPCLISLSLSSHLDHSISFVIRTSGSTIVLSLSLPTELIDLPLTLQQNRKHISIIESFKIVILFIQTKSELWIKFKK